MITPISAISAISFNSDVMRYPCRDIRMTKGKKHSCYRCRHSETDRSYITKCKIKIQVIERHERLLGYWIRNPEVTNTCKLFEDRDETEDSS